MCSGMQGTHMAVLGGWDVQQDTRNTRGSSEAEPLAHPAPAPGTVQLAPRGIACPKPLLCCPSAGCSLSTL